MKFTYEEIMEIINFTRYNELMCAKTSKCLMKKTLNPILKLKLYLSAKKFMAHVRGMDLILNALHNEAKKLFKD